MDLRVLLRASHRFHDDDARHMALHTLDRMAMGGLYDHLDGGFARYSTDERWLVPHFEKMLYDNALLTVCYLEAFQLTKDPFYRDIVEETLGWVTREMTSPAGPFFSTLDADSEGEEGKFYVWRADEIEKILGKEEARVFADVYGVLPEGNWDDAHHAGSRPKNILHRTKTFGQCANLLGMKESQLRARLQVARKRLFEIRAGRVPPGKDDKVLTSWNGLMIGAFALAAQVLDRPDYAAAAGRSADFILANMRGADGRLLRTWSAGFPAKLNAYLEDYAYLIDGLVTLYEATFELRWIEAALNLSEIMVDQFWDANEGGFFFTGRDHESLIARSKDPFDNATPAGNAVAATALLRLVRSTGRNDLAKKAEATLFLYRELLARHPTAAGQMLIALDFFLGPVQEFAVVGDPATAATRRVLRAIRQGFRPNKIIALLAPNSKGPPGLPLLEGKGNEGAEVATYICENFACQAPLLGAEALEKALAIQ
jgi:uncharacterized protein YyaL (SSP411 family)